MGLTGVAMETMRPSGPVKLESIESGIYKEVGLTVLFARGIVTGVVVVGGGGTWGSEPPASCTCTFHSQFWPHLEWFPPLVYFFCCKILCNVVKVLAISPG